MLFVVNTRRIRSFPRSEPAFKIRTVAKRSTGTTMGWFHKKPSEQRSMPTVPMELVSSTHSSLTGLTEMIDIFRDISESVAAFALVSARCGAGNLHIV